MSPAPPTVAAQVARLAAERPDAPAVRDPRRALTRAGLEREAAAAARVLAEAGVAAGGCVGVQLENRVELCAALLGAWRLGATAALIDPAVPPERARAALDAAGARVLVGRAAATAPAPAVLDVDSLAAAAPLAAAPAALAPDAPALVVFTSGSTGTPRGVVISHQALARNAAATRDYLGVGADDCAGLLLPLAGRPGQSALWAHLAGGGAAAVEPGFVAGDGRALERFAAAGVTGVSGVPTLLQILIGRRLLDADALPRLRYVRFAAGPWRTADVAHLCALYPGLRVIATYGLTETGEVSALRADRDDRPGSVGRPLADVELQIIGADGAAVPPGATGEVVVVSPRLMSGYVGEAGTGPLPRFVTGDLGRRDDAGFLYLEGRRAAMMKVAGENVSGDALERALLAVPGVAEAAVLPVADALLGEAPQAFVVAAPGTRLELDELRAALGRALPRASMPRRIELLASLPRLPGGKVDRRALLARPHKEER